MLVLAHRGASVALTENTPEAFELADALGADGVELDVRIVPDGRLVVVHDPLPETIAEIDALGPPSFGDVLDACGERMLVNVEIKNWHADSHFDPTAKMVEPVLDEMRRRGDGVADRWLISSFSFRTINACRVYAPEFPTAWLCYEVTAEVIDRVVAAGHVAVHPWETMLTAEAVEACHAAGLIVNSWTCNDPVRLRELEAIGVDGVCTDVPDIALDAIGRAASDGSITPRWPVASR